MISATFSWTTTTHSHVRTIPSQPDVIVLTHQAFTRLTRHLATLYDFNW
ncbi:TPA: hypothetical protein ACSJ8I_003053 [Escherichia coli]